MPITIYKSSRERDSLRQKVSKGFHTPIQNSLQNIDNRCKTLILQRFFFVYPQARRERMKHSFLRQINQCVDWRRIHTESNKKYTKTQNAVGNPAYDALMMFKILLLETWYGLSDYEVEERINDSLLFSEFLGLDLGFPAPDHSTFSRFRSELTRLGIMDKLLRELNKQFKKHGISRIDQGAIIDASIVDSPYAPTGGLVIEVAEDREDARSQEAKDQEQAYQYQLKSSKPGVDNEAVGYAKERLIVMAIKSMS